MMEDTVHVKFEAMTSATGEPIGVICSLHDLEKHTRYLAGVRMHNDSEVWYCKKKTFSSSMPLNDKEMNDIFEQYNLKDQMLNAWKDISNHD